VSSSTTVPFPPVRPNSSFSSRLNWLRAGVLGASDGIVSVSGTLIGVAAANPSRALLLTAGCAAVVAGATSMALGEYVSVSTQRDSEKSLLEKERFLLLSEPRRELEELVSLYRNKGLSEDTARRVARELTAHDGLAAHADAEYGLSTTAMPNPWQAALSSAVSFTVWGAVPTIAILLSPITHRIMITALAVLFALTLTGATAAKLGSTSALRTARRVVAGGILAMVLTYIGGHLTGRHP